VVATPTAIADGATVDITGDTDLVTGPNTVTAVVTAEDDVTTQTYTVTVNVAENDDTTLGVFAVNGTDVTNGATVELPYGTTEVEYVAEASDVEAAVVVTVDEELATGANTLTVVVTAADGTSTATYTVTLNVAENDDTSLGVFAIDGNDVVSGATIDLPFGTTEVEYVAEASDVDAAVVVTVDEDLVTGPNTLTVVVTAADGTSTATYTVTLNVLENDDATLGVFAINGADVESGETVNLPFGTTEVEYVAEAADPDAAVVVDVVEELVTGANTLTVTVTAANGTTTATYTVTLSVQANDDVTLGIFSVNGDDVVDGGSVNLANGVTSVTVVAEPSDTAATAVVTGATSLITGTNTLTVVVTAANGTTTATYTVSLVVAGLGGEFSNDTSLSTFKIDGKTVVDGGSLNVGLGRTSVTVEAVPTNAYATAVAAGNTNLVDGSNPVTVTVTADDGTVKVYSVSVIVAAPSSVKTISSVTVNSTDFTTGFNADQSFDLPFGTTQATVSVTPTSNVATVAVTNNTGLSAGVNNVSVVVTAEDGTTANYTVKLNVAAANANTALSALTVNGSSLLTASSLDLPFGTTAVSVEATTEASTSTFIVLGNSNLVTGSNTLTVRVTAQSGATADVVKTLNVLAASSDKAITGITVNGTVVEGSAITLATGVTSATVLATLSSPFASYAVTGASSLNPGANTVTITVTAQNGSTEDTQITVTVAQPSAVNTLSGITVDDVAVVEDETVEKVFGTTSVVVVATPTSNLATAVVTGDTDLISGLNTVTISVTAESGAVATYEIFVNVAKSSVKTLASITANGETVTDGGSINLPIGTTQVSVIAIPTSSEATAVVTNNTGLSAGSNTVNIAVTAADGTVANYSFTAVVAAANANTALSALTVNGSSLLTASSLDLPFGTTAVSVEATTEASTSTFIVLGNSNLVTGSNTLTVRVTAQSGATQDFVKTLNVLAASSDKAITGITVNGSVVEGSAITLATGVTSATVLATLSSPFASYAVTGASSLNPGANTVTITVTAQDGSTAATDITVTVAQPSTVNTLSSITVDGETVVAGDTVNKTFGTTSVVVVATPTSNLATAVVTGDTDLVSGLNTVTVSVTAESGAVANYTLTINVAKSSDKTLASITANGQTVTAGGTVNLASGTTSVNVVALATSPDATVAVSGNTGLVAGANTVTVTVTAGDLTTQAYTFTANVLTLSEDTSLALFTINGQDALTNSTITVGNEVTEIFVVAQTTSSAATFLALNSPFVSHTGPRLFQFRVTAENTAFTRLIEITVIREAAVSDNANLGTITVNGTATAAGSTVNVAAGTTSVTVVATAEDAGASTTVDGDTDLKTGNNTVTVFVTAASSRVVSYTFTVNVPASNNTNLTGITVNGQSVALNDLVFNVPAITTSVVVAASTEDVDATFAVTGEDALVTGDNEVVITVTAADGTTTREYTLNVIRASVSSNTALGTITLNGATVADGATVNVPFGTTEVFVTATGADAEATTEVTGTTELETGTNEITIVVTAPSGATATYTVTVNVLALSSDTSLAVFTADGVAVVDGGVLNLDGINNFVAVVAQATSPAATVEITGSADIPVGESEIVVVVTAEDGTTATYTLTVNLRDRTIATLSTFTVNGVEVIDGETVDFPSGTEEAEIVALPTDEEALVEIEGGTGLEPGENVVTITVTAVDEVTVEVYTVILDVALSADTSLSEFTANGEVVEDGSEIELPANTTEIEIVAVPTDENANVEIIGADALVPGDNTIEVIVTAANGDTLIYSLFVLVVLSADNSVSDITVGGESVQDGDVVLTTDLEITEIDVEVTTNDENATVEITGNTELVLGDNLITIVVTAANFESREIRVTFRIGGLAGNTRLESLNVGGVKLNLEEAPFSVNLPAGTKTAPVIAFAVDDSSKIKVEGNKDLVAGANTVTVTVTAADSITVRTYTVTVNVAALSSNSNISSLKVNGTSVANGATFQLPAGSGFADCIAVPEDAGSIVTYTGNKNLVTGNNPVVVKVTAADGTHTNYTMTLVVPALSSDKSLSTFTIQGFNVLGKSRINVLPGTTKLKVTAIAAAAGSSVTIVGRDIQPGLNDVVVTVTAADGTSQTYTVRVKA
jgi:hypothetical protein